MTTRSSLMREDDRTGVSETRPDRQYRMPPCPIHSQFRVVGHDLGGTTHRTCPLSDFEPRSTWLKGATWEIPGKCIAWRPCRRSARPRSSPYSPRSTSHLLDQICQPRENGRVVKRRARPATQSPRGPAPERNDPRFGTRTLTTTPHGRQSRAATRCGALGPGTPPRPTRLTPLVYRPSRRSSSSMGTSF